MNNDPKLGIMVQVQIKHDDNMNVFLYGGKNRTVATKSIVADNASPQEGEIYAFDYNEGILVVAYPNKDVATELEFDYWVAPYEGPPFFSFRGENAETNMVIFCVAITAVIVLLTIGGYYIFKKYQKAKD